VFIPRPETCIGADVTISSWVYYQLTANAATSKARARDWRASTEAIMHALSDRESPCTFVVWVWGTRMFKRCGAQSWEVGGNSNHDLYIKCGANPWKVRE
jgi:hypothetical protein